MNLHGDARYAASMQYRASHSKLSYFMPFDERVILMVPVLGLMTALTQLIFFPSHLGNLDQNVMKLVVGTVLLNTVHVVFPFVLLASVPRWRQMLVKKVTGNKGTLFLFWTILVALIVFVFSLISVSGYVRFSDPVHSLGEKILFWIFLIAPVFHGMRQSGGFSLLINRGLVPHLEENEKKSLKVFAERERSLLTGVYIGTILMIVASQLSIFKWGSLNLGFMVGGLMAFGCATTLLFTIKKVPYFNKTNKLIFAIRFIVWPMSILSPIAGWTVMLMHGLEYIGLCRRVIRAERSEQVKQFVVFGLLISSGIIVLYRVFDFMMSRPEASLYEMVESSLTLTLILAIFPFLTLGHYIVDAVIYRMRDKDVSECMDPYLSGLLSRDH